MSPEPQHITHHQKATDLMALKHWKFKEYYAKNAHFSISGTTPVQIIVSIVSSACKGHFLVSIYKYIQYWTRNHGNNTGTVPFLVMGSRQVVISGYQHKYYSVPILVLGDTTQTQYMYCVLPSSNSGTPTRQIQYTYCIPTHFQYAHCSTQLYVL